MRSFDFQQLFILDLANNHQGSVDHAKALVSAHGEVVRRHGLRAALKFQFRDLDTFIHPAHREKSENKHVPRFLSTRLDRGAWKELSASVRDEGMVTMATPFDEASVDLVDELGIEVIKVASCSAMDRPLLQRVAESRRPVVASTGGLTLSQIDYLATFLSDRKVDFALMVCMAIYPTPREQLRLNQITLLRRRYKPIPIGFSTHEDPLDCEPVQIAFAKGATLFERHVGLPAEGITLNGYSSTPAQLDAWLSSYRRVVLACGGEERSPSPDAEVAALQSLRRGVFARKAISSGEELTDQNTYLAMPCAAGVLSANEWRDGLRALRDYVSDEALDLAVAEQATGDDFLLTDILLQTRGILQMGRIPIGKESEVEISHHYGLEHFREFGAFIVTCVNRSYTKKLVVMLPRQKHPYHRHKVKEETFQLLHGDLEVVLDGHRNQLEVGDVLLIEPGAWHKFHSLNGCVFEEISTTHREGDSFYEDPKIAVLSLSERKTKIPNWEKKMRELI